MELVKSFPPYPQIPCNCIKEAISRITVNQQFINFFSSPVCRLLIYGQYCSHMEHAQTTLNHLMANREDVRQKVEVT